MNFPTLRPKAIAGKPNSSTRLQALPKEDVETSRTPTEPNDSFVSGDNKRASNWSTFTPLKKAVLSTVSGWWGAVLGGAAIVGATAASPVVAMGLGAAAGVALAQGATRLTKSEKTRAQVKEAKAKRAEEPSSWKTASLGEKAQALGMAGGLGAAFVGVGLIVAGGVAPALALAVGAGTGMAAAAGALAISKDSDGTEASYSSSGSDSSSPIGVTADGKVGFHMGGGMVVGTDGKVGFGFEL